MLHFLESGAGNGMGSMGSTIIMLVIMVAVFYFMLIRARFLPVISLTIATCAA